VLLVGKPAGRRDVGDIGVILEAGLE